MNRNLIMSLFLVDLVWVFTLMFGGYRLVDTFYEVQIVSTGLFPDWALPATVILQGVLLVILKVNRKTET